MQRGTHLGSPSPGRKAVKEAKVQQQHAWEAAAAEVFCVAHPPAHLGLGCSYRGRVSVQKCGVCGSSSVPRSFWDRECLSASERSSRPTSTSCPGSVSRKKAEKPMYVPVLSQRCARESARRHRFIRSGKVCGMSRRAAQKIWQCSAARGVKCCVKAEGRRWGSARPIGHLFH